MEVRSYSISPFKLLGVLGEGQVFQERTIENNNFAGEVDVEVDARCRTDHVLRQSPK